MSAASLSLGGSEMEMFRQWEQGTWRQSDGGQWQGVTRDMSDGGQWQGGSKGRGGIQTEGSGKEGARDVEAVRRRAVARREQGTWRQSDGGEWQGGNTHHLAVSGFFHSA